jgi:hypothetical protein
VQHADQGGGGVGIVAAIDGADEGLFEAGLAEGEMKTVCRVSTT